MTGVAANLCDDESEIKELGYEVKDDQITDEKGNIISTIGNRRAILTDLSIAGAYIASEYTPHVNTNDLVNYALTVLAEIEEKYDWVYRTKHTDGEYGKINYVVWSDVFTCSTCANDIVFYNEAVDMENKKVLSEFTCPHCQSLVNKKNLQRKKVVTFDKLANQVVERA